MDMAKEGSISTTAPEATAPEASEPVNIKVIGLIGA